MPTRVLVTGATGFIGRATCATLRRRGHQVHRVSRSATGAHRLDLLTDDPSRILDAVCPDVVLHLAWVAPPADYRNHVSNATWAYATRRLARLAQENGVERQVFAGTSLEHAEATTRYAQAKQSLRAHIGRDLAPDTWAWARPFLVYGPGEAPERLIPTLARHLSSGQTVSLGPGTAVRDLVHVEDVAEALVAMVEGDGSGDIDVGTGRATQIAEVARIAARIAGRLDLLRLGQLPARSEPPRLVANTRTLRRIGAETRIPLEVGLAEALRLARPALEAA
ncbi:MAG: NAD-dependent epimerase/dehydratase family protein [Myxococcota bacterium]